MNCGPKELNLNMAVNSHRETSETLTPKKKPLHELPIFKKINESILQLDNLVKIPMVRSKAQSGSSNVQTGPSNKQSQTAPGPAVTRQRSLETQSKFTETLQGQSIPQRVQHPTAGKVFPVRQSSEQLNFNHTSETWIDSAQYNVQPHSYSQFERNNSPTKNQNNAFVKTERTSKPQPPVDRGGPKSFDSNKNLPKSRPIIPPPRPPNTKPKLFCSKSDSGFNSQTDTFDSQNDTSFTSESNKNTIKTGEREKGEHHSTENMKKKNCDLIIIPDSFKTIIKKNRSGVLDTNDSKSNIFGRINVNNNTVPQVKEIDRTDLKTGEGTSSNLPDSDLSKIKDALRNNKDGLVLISEELLYTLLTPSENKGDLKNESDQSNSTRYAPSAPPLDLIY